MQKLIIKGKRNLSGNIKISGSKNATLPILAASILNNQKIEISNTPLVKDVITMVELLKYIGSNIKINYKRKKIVINNKKKKFRTLAPYKLLKTMRAGVIVLGPLYMSMSMNPTFIAKSTPGDHESATSWHLKNFETNYT